jgi:hypothetical protein
MSTPSRPTTTLTPLAERARARALEPIRLVGLALVFVTASTATAASPPDHRWRFAAAAGNLSPDASFESVDPIDGVRQAAEGDSNEGWRLELEMRLTTLLGIEVQVADASLPIETEVEIFDPSSSETLALFTDRSNLDFQPVTLGLVFHFSPGSSRRIELELQPQLAYVVYGDLDLFEESPSAHTSLRSENDWGWGIEAGLDFWFRAEGRWGLGASLQFLDTSFRASEVDDLSDGESISFDTSAAWVGLAVRF